MVSLIALNTNGATDVIVERLQKANKSQERYELAIVLTGDSIEWSDDYLTQNDDDLGKALLKLAWLNGPLDDMSPTTSQLEIGLEIVIRAQAPPIGLMLYGGRCSVLRGRNPK